MNTAKSVSIKSFKFILILTILCGLIYPLFITGLSQLIFHDQANGSIIEVNGIKYGSKLLGQQYTGDGYLWGRIMNIDTNTFKDSNGKPFMYGSPSNLSPASKKYEKLVKERIDKIKNSNPSADTKSIPVDLVTCSGSGMDPDISVAAAMYQVPRIAKNRNLSEEQVQKVINQYTSNRFIGIFGEKVVHVLEVNLALDGILK
jgi:K+-transporting ATPase, C subunit